MTMIRFVRAESGAVTVDWTVLTAGLAALGLATLGVVSLGARTASEGVRDELAGISISYEWGSGAAAVVQDFADGIDGWALSRNVNSGALEHSGDPGSDGAPGYLRFTDGGGGGAAYLAMAAPFTGDQSGMSGGTISYDMRLFSGGRYLEGGNHDHPELVLTGADGTVMTLSQEVRPSRDAWSGFSAALSAEAGWEIDGAPASQARIDAVLADVATTEIRVEQAYGGGEVVGLDAVRFDPPG